jgi:hypothetical protein
MDGVVIFKCAGTLCRSGWVSDLYMAAQPSMSRHPGSDRRLAT